MSGSPNSSINDQGTSVPGMVVYKHYAGWTKIDKYLTKSFSYNPMYSNHYYYFS